MLVLLLYFGSLCASGRPVDSPMCVVDMNLLRGSPHTTVACDASH